VIVGSQSADFLSLEELMSFNTEEAHISSMQVNKTFLSLQRAYADDLKRIADGEGRWWPLAFANPGSLRPAIFTKPNTDPNLLLDFNSLHGTVAALLREDKHKIWGLKDAGVTLLGNFVNARAGLEGSNALPVANTYEPKQPKIPLPPLPTIKKL
jgi:hypothetical protein